MFYAEFSKLLETTKEQKFDVDTFLQYFVWNALPTGMQDTLINISNTCYPKLSDVKIHFLEACGRFEAHKTKPKKATVDSTVSSNATNLKTDSGNDSAFNTSNTKVGSKYLCLFCSSENHKTISCTKYETVESRRGRVRELKLCFRCLKTGHGAASCTYQHKVNCFKCDKKHWSFLCEGKSTQKGDQKGDQKGAQKTAHNSSKGQGTAAEKTTSTNVISSSVSA